MPTPDSRFGSAPAARAGHTSNPYTGEARPLAGQGWRSFFGVMIEWHRWLGTGPENRAVGKAITGVCNAAFLGLALSGLYLWWPRRWNLRAMRLSLWFRGGLAGKVRDWNWHNVIGFWSLPVLIVITSSGMMISYRWVTNLIYAVAGEAPPAGPGAARRHRCRCPDRRKGHGRRVWTSCSPRSAGNCLTGRASPCACALPSGPARANPACKPWR